ncbi:MAG: zinc transporter ZntB [Chloroflexaceae bacterium]|nr:zinc transporter ZntB [Chloroflexaceae bacterium]NJO07932.1 zinc transporter ZntB [Chloroflexaceae bacterium]
MESIAGIPMIGEQSGLILAYILDGRGGGREAGWQEIAAWQASDGVLWVHLDYTKADARTWIREQLTLPRLVHDALLAPEARPRSVVINDGLLIVLQGVSPDLDEDPGNTISLRVWIDNQRIISTRMRRVLPIILMRYALREGNGPQQQGEFLVLVIERIISVMEKLFVKIHTTIDELEDHMMDDEHTLSRKNLAAVRRAIIVLRRYLLPQQESLHHIQQQPLPWLNREQFDFLAEVSEKLGHYYADLESLSDRAAVIQEELASRLTEQLNRRMYMLSILSGVFLPLTFLTGLLGVNIGGIPGQNDAWAFLIFSLIIVLMGVLQILVFRWLRWL